METILILFFLSFYCFSFDFGFKSRNWYLGGNFSKVVNFDGTEVSTNNIAYFDGYVWHGFDNGTDGKVHTIFVDSCLNVYIGGEFSKVSNVETGPIAVQRYGNNYFEKVHDIDFKSTSSQIVNSISVDCKNIPASLSLCDCDIYVGGIFELETIDASNGNNISAHNVVFYDSFLAKDSSSKGNVNRGWQSFETLSSSNLDNEVLFVSKRNYGMQVTSNFLYLGGKFEHGTSYYDMTEFSEIKDSDSSSSSSSFVHHPIPSEYTSSSSSSEIQEIDFVYYDPINYSLESFIISGTFTFPIEDESTNCTNLCEYNWEEKKWSSIYNQNKTIVKIEKNEDFLFIGGTELFAKIDLSVDPEQLFTPLINDGEDERTSFLNETIESASIRDFYICKNIDFGCSSNSFAIINEEGNAYFFNDEKQKWLGFGSGSDGQFLTIGTIFDYYNS